MLFPTDKIFEKEQRQAFFGRLFRKIFLDDWLMKLIALVITLALWLGVSGLREPITTPFKGIPLTLRFSNDVDVTNSPVEEVDIVVTGDKRKIAQINKENLIVSLDLTEVQAGERIIQLTPETVGVELPTGIKLEEIQPSKIAVKLEKVEEREVPVKAETEGIAAEGFEIYSTTILPQKVRVRGPESSIKTLDSVSTEKINVENLESDFTAKQISLNVVNPKVRPLDTVVDVIFRIGEKRVERLFLVPVSTEAGEKRVKVVLYGPQSLLANLRSNQLQVVVVKTEAGEDSPQLVLPAEIQSKVEIRDLKII